jgi:hypothetical protein
MWMKRELLVFDFLNGQTSSATADRRRQNAEFRMEYAMAILKSIDIRSSTGQAQEPLTQFLGRDNSALFLHELEAWLRARLRSRGIGTEQCSMAPGEDDCFR